LQNVLIDGFSGNPSASGGGPAEVTLDIELMIALAPGIDRILVYETDNDLAHGVDVLNRIASDNIAHQISTSWGANEVYVGSSIQNGENTAFQQMATQGQSFYAASGDDGDQSWTSAGLQFGPSDPASQPYVVGVGGTTLSTNGPGGTYSSETAWTGSGTGGGSGGGVSTWPRPSFQPATVSPGSGGSATNRNVPDVSLNANPDTGYSIYYSGGWYIYGGTSCAAPLWAAYTALVNQARAANGAGLLGYPNPVLYSAAQTSQYACLFHDVTSGNNGTYPAVSGYDNVTGWGSFHGLSFTSPAAPTGVSASQSPACPGTQVTLTAGGSSAGTLRWYSGSCGGTYLGSGRSIVLTAPSASTTYYVRTEDACTQSGCASIPLTVLTPVAADLNHDCDVDLDDLATFQACLSGPGVPYSGDCAKADFDQDGDVDQDDFGVFQRCYSGSSIPADPACAG
jgi:kumamolisin